MMYDNNTVQSPTMSQTTMKAFFTPNKKQQLKHNPYSTATISITTPSKKPSRCQPTLRTIVPPLPNKYNNLVSQKTTSHRIIFMNINRLQPKETDRLLEITQYMKQHSVDIFGVCETNINWTDTNLYQKLLRNTRKQLGDSKATLNTSEIAFTQAVRSAQMAKP